MFVVPHKNKRSRLDYWSSLYGAVMGTILGIVYNLYRGKAEHEISVIWFVSGLFFMIANFVINEEWGEDIDLIARIAPSSLILAIGFFTDASAMFAGFLSGFFGMLLYLLFEARPHRRGKGVARPKEEYL
jgi:hypothetical protein